MKRIIFSIISLVLFSACDTLLQDRDVSPRLALTYINKTEDYLLFSFDMYALENINSFACEILFDDNIFDANTEEFSDANNNGHYEINEEFIDCGIDNLCNEYEIGDGSCENSDCDSQNSCETTIGYCEDSSCDNEDDCKDEDTCNSSWFIGCSSIWHSEDPAGDDYIEGLEDITRTEGNGHWDNITVLLNGELISEELENFYTFSETEPGKVSIGGGFYEYNQYPMEFSEIDFNIALIILKIKDNIDSTLQETMITIGNWQLLQQDGNGAYFGGMVVTDTLYVNFE